MTEQQSSTPERSYWQRTPLPEDAASAPAGPAAAPPEQDAATLDALVPRRLYAEAAGGYGEAFLAYLDLDLAEPVHGSEVTDFVERYVGHFADRWSFLRSQLDDLGWSAAFTHFKAEQGIWPDDLRWDPEVLWEHMGERYAICEQFGGVHVFRR